MRGATKDMSGENDHEPEILREAAPSYQGPSPLETDRDIDLSLLEDSLRLTPWQRLVENDRALGLVRMLERARARLDGTSNQDS